jgi:hypothetical protein
MSKSLPELLKEQERIKASIAAAKSAAAADAPPFDGEIRRVTLDGQVLIIRQNTYVPPKEPDKAIDMIGIFAPMLKADGQWRLEQRANLSVAKWNLVAAVLATA